MPHVVFEPGSQSAGGSFSARMLIPGIEPGMGIRNIFAQRRMKRALLLEDAWIKVNNLSTPATADFMMVRVGLKLSQDSDLDPGLVIPVAEVLASNKAATVSLVDSLVVTDLFHEQGGVWMPAFIGVFFSEPSTTKFTDWNIDLHLRYSVVEVPWEQWFIGWDFLDNVVNNEEQF